MAKSNNESALRVLVAGEALIDLVPIGEDATYRAAPGGSPFNVAIGLARLNVPTGFVGRLSTDPFGRQLVQTLRSNGVATDSVHMDTGPTTLAVVSRDSEDEPQYAFYGDRTADQQLLPQDLPSPLPASVLALHVGSYAMVSEPIGSTLTQWMRQEHEHCVISFDPNVRPRMIPDMEAYRRQVAEWIALSHVVKLSVSDLTFLEPNGNPNKIAQRWLQAGPKLIVLTAGSQGAAGFTQRTAADVAAPVVQVVDSVGAGDAFMAGLLAKLYHQDQLSLDAFDRLSKSDLIDLLDFAASSAAMTCTRPGADPPRWEELPS